MKLKCKTSFWKNDVHSECISWTSWSVIILCNVTQFQPPVWSQNVLLNTAVKKKLLLDLSIGGFGRKIRPDLCCVTVWDVWLDLKMELCFIDQRESDRGRFFFSLDWCWTQTVLSAVWKEGISQTVFWL